MYFALVDNQRISPLPRLKAVCPVCGGPMIPKCGNVRVHHWAHLGKRACDTYWEPETEWHRSWKRKFPESWWEIILHDQNGGKHIADVHTKHGLTIEFQHSHLRPQERTSREASYANMVWVVDGSRLTGDLPRFKKGSSSFSATGTKGIFITSLPEDAFPKDWLHCAAPVFFDFPDIPGTDARTGSLIGLLPGRVFDHAVVVRVSRESFVRAIMDRAELLPVSSILSRVAEAFLAKRAIDIQAARLRDIEIAIRMSRARKPLRWHLSRRRRRF